MLTRNTRRPSINQALPEDAVATLPAHTPCTPLVLLRPVPVMPTVRAALVPTVVLRKPLKVATADLRQPTLPSSPANPLTSRSPFTHHRAHLAAPQAPVLVFPSPAGLLPRPVALALAPAPALPSPTLLSRLVPASLSTLPVFAATLSHTRPVSPAVGLALDTALALANQSILPALVAIPFLIHLVYRALPLAPAPATALAPDNPLTPPALAAIPFLIHLASQVPAAVAATAPVPASPSTRPASVATPFPIHRASQALAQAIAPARATPSTPLVLAATLSHLSVAVPTHLGLEPQVVVSTRPAPLQEA